MVPADPHKTELGLMTTEFQEPRGLVEYNDTFVTPITCSAQLLCTFHTLVPSRGIKSVSGSRYCCWPIEIYRTSTYPHHAPFV